MKFSIITLFPEIFKENLDYSILKRAQQKGLVEFNIVSHREFGIGKHKIVDDKPYGGGVGMLLRVDVLKKAIDSAKTGEKGEKVILLSAKGQTYKQEVAENLSSLSHIILVCGHYEGFDERIRKYTDMEISIGDFVLTGGEIPALAIIDSITRLIPGVLEKTDATQNESFSKKDGQRILETPHYTRPEEFEGESVPKIFLSGDPKQIEVYEREKAMKETRESRPDLLTLKGKHTNH